MSEQTNPVLIHSFIEQLDLLSHRCTSHLVSFTLWYQRLTLVFQLTLVITNILTQMLILHKAVNRNDHLMAIFHIHSQDDICILLNQQYYRMVIFLPSNQQHQRTESISLNYLFTFFIFSHFLVVGSVPQIKLTYVSFWAHVKIASHIVSYCILNATAQVRIK